MMENTVKNTNLIKKANRALVVDAIRNYQPLKIEEIIRLTGLSRQTVFTIMKDLTEDRIIEKSGVIHQSVGRQPSLYVLSTDSHFAIGIDVDVSPIYLAVARLDGTLVYKEEWRVLPDITPDVLLDSVTEHIFTVMNRLNLTKEKVIGIGMGMPAVVNIARNTAERISRVNGWNDIDAAKIIEKRTGIKTLIRNDAHLLACLEISQENQDFLYILHRSGIGMAPVIGGAVYEGMFGNSGYLGHTQVGSLGRKCDCGLVDCMETYCSKRAISSMYFERTGENLGYDQLIERSASGDETASEVFREAGHYFGIGIGNAVKMYDVQKVIIGDLRCTEDHVFFRSIVDSINESTSNFRFWDMEIRMAGYESDMNGLGGCQYVLNRFFREPKLQTNVVDITP